MKRTALLPFVALAAVTALTLSGCVNNEADTPAASGAAADVKKDDAAAKLLPADIVKAGTLTLGTDATYAPNEFKDADGNPIGWEIELADAMAAKLGLKTKYQVAKFDNIIPGITGGKYDIGLSSFFDTQERQKQVDMVDYYQAGIQWATPAGKTVDPDNACGITLAVQNGTTEALDDGPAKSKACTDAGKPEIKLLGYDTQDDATAAVTLGRADALSADSPVTLYAVKQSKGKLEVAGDPYSVFLYGMPIAKDRGTLGQALQAALQSLQDDGTYAKILKKWGVEDGAIDKIDINGATS
ncbi:ABC transporter substrate-binding protein [Schumannella luteola]|uniref:Polar amino acid transport system substrate-binding protein n=1 Tax=Schumannella luteola TaxID=472059 RepID=A0A852YBS3_9MICO|nr:ABC transporter substrate-binding protein [Schumannella luteola]NYH00407.1 polar amino acid transport system substrate-binding protein [Schumannella luteola]TPX03680.1 ABC transporter substrate-binding protein [Schumannella luteola]